MARAVWSGSLTFGLVTLPVALVTATESHTVRFHQLERGTSDRLRNKRVNERTGKEVPYEKIVKGYDADDEYVIIEPDELDDITPGRSKAIEITGFADLEEIEPIYFDATYFVQPKSDADSKTYGLLRDALEESGRAGIATLTMRQKEYLVAVHTEGGVVVMHTLHWADEVRDPHATLEHLPSAAKASPKERKMAVQLIEAMAMEWDPHDYRDRTQERVRDLVKAKQSGKSVEKSEPAPDSTKVVDLMSALEASVDQARGGSGERRSSRTRRPASTRGGSRTRSRSQSRSEDLSEMTKADLYERATQEGIPGRSGMSRDELQEAVAGAGRRSRTSGGKTARSRRKAS
ncbi:Ku protein [Streptomyces sp. NPDC051776]|uniref:non-homologous end joining protein Ku n=1 Tax=Streptomyces sp. NPDC051776 TaxID=3155414 RepID=UPI00344A4D52